MQATGENILKSIYGAGGPGGTIVESVPLYQHDIYLLRGRDENEPLEPDNEGIGAVWFSLINADPEPYTVANVDDANNSIPADFEDYGLSPLSDSSKPNPMWRSAWNLCRLWQELGYRYSYSMSNAETIPPGVFSNASYAVPATGFMVATIDDDKYTTDDGRKCVVTNIKSKLFLYGDDKYYKRLFIIGGYALDNSYLNGSVNVYEPALPTWVVIDLHAGYTLTEQKDSADPFKAVYFRTFEEFYEATLEITQKAGYHGFTGWPLLVVDSVKPLNYV